jgi:hypothetical protein
MPDTHRIVVQPAVQLVYAGIPGPSALVVTGNFWQWPNGDRMLWPNGSYMEAN